jgi:restriction system protein
MPPGFERDVLAATVDGLVAALKAGWPVLVLLAALPLFRSVRSVYRWLRLRRSGIRELDRMDGRTFEHYLELVFRRRGFAVERTPTSGDFGGDLVLRRGEERTVVQAKRYQGKVGVKAVQEAVAARGYYRCAHAIVVTNSFFTRPAHELADANDVELWDREALVQALLSSGRPRKPAPEADHVPSAAPSLSPQAARSRTGRTCAECGRPVSGRALQFCLANRRRFGGRVYCSDHQ